MRTPVVLLLLSLAALSAGLALPGYSDVLLVAAPACLGSLWLVWRARRARPAAARRWIVLDGSNVMHWKGETPRLDTVRAVLRHLERQGYAPGVVFDANAGHLLEGKYLSDAAFARRLRLPVDRVMVVDAGTPADPVLLEAARDLGAPIVTNDRFRDWSDRFPDVRRPGALIQGGYRDGRLWLSLDAPAVATQAPRAQPA